jgi:hypothetical protein
MKQLFTNNAVSLLASGITSTSTTLTVLDGMGALFPNPGADEFFTVTLEDQAASVREIIWVTGRTGDVFTGLMRGQEGTTPVAWAATLGSDTLVDHRLTAYTLNRFEAGAMPGEAVFDGTFDLDITGPQATITLPVDYKANSTCVWVGGLRQKRGVDYVELGSNQIQLQFTLTQDEIDDGQNIVVDYVAA